jgi:anti-sigma B factor antagonist
MNLVAVSQAQGRVPVTVLQLQGRVNLGNTKELEQAAKEAFAAGGRDMVIDLSKAPSLTSAGIRAIQVIRKLLADSGMDKAGHLKLVSPTPYVRDVLEVAGLLEYIEVFTSLDEAVASF